MKERSKAFLPSLFWFISGQSGVIHANKHICLSLLHLMKCRLPVGTRRLLALWVPLWLVQPFLPMVSASGSQSVMNPRITQGKVVKDTDAWPSR